MYYFGVECVVLSLNVEVVCCICIEWYLVVIVFDVVVSIYDLEILYSNIEDNFENIICFLVIGCERIL